MKTPLTISMLTNMALVEAWDRGAPISACECRHWFDLTSDSPIFNFQFGDWKYLCNRKVMRSPEIYARSWDEGMVANGLLFTIRFTEDMFQLDADEARKLIGDEVSAVLYNLAAVRMAG